MSKYKEYELKPESPILLDMIGQKIVDIGYFEFYLKSEDVEVTHQNSRTEFKRWRKKLSDEDGLNWKIRFSYCLQHIFILVLEKQQVAIMPDGKTIYPQVAINSNLTLEKANELSPTLGHHFYSVKQDPDMSDEMVQEMIGKKILAIDLIRLAKHEHYITVDNAYCILKFYLEGGLEKLIGIQFEPSGENIIQVKNGNDIDPSVIGEIFPIRKKGFKIK